MRNEIAWARYLPTLKASLPSDRYQNKCILLGDNSTRVRATLKVEHAIQCPNQHATRRHLTTVIDKREGLAVASIVRDVVV